jgi:hypothetical protein
MTPEQIVQQNLDFYNLRDTEGFVSCLDQNFRLYPLGEAVPSVVGLDQAKEMYGEIFENSPQLHSDILTRIVIGNKVIDHESIVGRNGSDEVLELVLVYETTGDKISRITVIRE